MQSSTNTLTIRVCTCDREGNMNLCNAEALTARAGLSTGALVAILLCVIILQGQFPTRRQFRGSHCSDWSLHNKCLTAVTLVKRVKVLQAAAWRLNCPCIVISLIMMK
uniref:Uncharacterized protein n=1 Tax=Amphiprion percula TaxID=161767 RepID=A0A3P8SK63_AMPPE